MATSDWMKAGRVDLSDWVIHFVHERRLDEYPDPFSWAGPAKSEQADELTEDEARRIADQCEAESAGRIPSSFDQTGPQYWDLDRNDEEYSWESDACAITVLKKIVSDGFLRAGWSFRKGRATTYGPRPSVCFTEMPLYALLDYAKKRSHSGFVDTYAIALKREELFQAGGRPVIYGLTGEVLEA